MRFSIVLSTLLGLGSTALAASIPVNSTVFDISKLDYYLNTAQPIVGGSGLESRMQESGQGWTLDEIATEDREVEALPTLDLSWMTENVSRVIMSSNSAKFICDTTWASPRLHDIDRLYKILMQIPNSWCTNSNMFASKCTMIAQFKDGDDVHSAVSLCGDQFKVRCHEVATAFMAIKRRCKWTLYAGGRWFFEDNQIVALHK